MGVYRIEVYGREKQADIEKGFQQTKKKAGSFPDGKDAIASAKAISELYDEDRTIIVWETKQGQEWNHFETKGKANQDMHDKRPEKPKKEPKAPKEPKQKAEKKPKGKGKVVKLPAPEKNHAAQN